MINVEMECIVAVMDDEKRGIKNTISYSEVMFSISGTTIIKWAT